jgi:hypothetical protein
MIERCAIRCRCHVDVLPACLSYVGCVFSNGFVYNSLLVVNEPMNAKLLEYESFYEFVFASGNSPIYFQPMRLFAF